MFAALLGAAIPLATFVQGWWQRERELKLQELQQLQQIRLAYMNLMVEGGVERVEALADFIAETEQDPAIKAWAASQRDKARLTMKELESKIAEEQKKAVAAESERKEAEQRAAKAEALARQLASANADHQQKAQAQKAVEEAKAALVKAEASATLSQTRVARTRETLLGRPLQMQQVAPPVEAAGESGERPSRRGGRPRASRPRLPRRSRRAW